MKRRTIGYWLIAWFFTVLFGEIVTGIISNNPTFFQHFIPITIYYGVIALIIALLFDRMKPRKVLAIVFLYGGVVEVLFFRGISIFVIAGLFYVFLFGVPYLISQKIFGEGDNT